MQSLLFFLASWKCQNVDCASFLVHFFNRLWISVESAKISWQKYFQCTDSIIITHKTASPDTTPNAPEYSNCQYKWIRPTTSSYSIANALKFHICTNKNRQLAYYLACSLRQHFLKSQFLCIMSHQWLTHHFSGALWLTSNSLGSYAPLKLPEVPKRWCHDTSNRKQQEFSSPMTSSTALYTAYFTMIHQGPMSQ